MIGRHPATRNSNFARSRRSSLATIPSLWGHTAGIGASPEDLAFIEQKRRAFLGTP
jgi:hypothetical protein